MLRRAKCTLYCAQTMETLGKDSELAVTLAQGKPVVVYVPRIEGNQGKYKKLCDTIAAIHAAVNQCEKKDYYVTKLMDRHAKDVPGSTELKTWSLQKLQAKLIELDHNNFEKKAEQLRDRHPLGIQVNLTSGVANGVLVVRTLTECAKVLKDILLNRLQFGIARDSNGTLRLVEQTTKCTYRLMVSDPILTNSFWNFYKPWLRA
ncbi:hypothetical protein YTPLAS18_11780 [Nitrospira sp.]|nr:hypothetical protein YTPLAS18_11780 [Nitrospira sp.]